MPTLDSLTPQPHLSAFCGFGIELEYMIVDCDSLSVRPLAERLLEGPDGTVANEVEHGALAWSNELVAHVIELKTNGPAPALDDLPDRFARAVVEINCRLARDQACLLPTAMHPLFDPRSETRLWPHGQRAIYQAYDRIFGCRGHGWSNLQSMHVNLPFADNAEFTRLHAAIRAVLPLIPALSAASPLEQGQRSAWLDGRLRYYRDNQCRVPSISGPVVPEAVTGIGDYRERILAPMYREIAPFDPHGILCEDWLNSRAAIARFERQTIEIRIIDLQECPAMDLAIAQAVVALVRAFYDEDLAKFDRQQAVPAERLAQLLWRAAERGGAARLEDPAVARLYGQPAAAPLRQIWQALLPRLSGINSRSGQLLEQLLRRGSLAEAIIGQLGAAPDRAAIVACYRHLADCLADNRPFMP